MNQQRGSASKVIKALVHITLIKFTTLLKVYIRIKLQIHWVKLLSFLKNNFYYLFILGYAESVAVPGPFSSCDKRGLLFIAVLGIFIAVASLIAEHTV